MRKCRLEQLDSLLDEIAEEQARLKRDRARADRIEEQLGVGCLFGAEDFRGREQDISRRIAEYRAEAAALRGRIDSIRDSITRRAMRLRYLDGLCWADIARRMGYGSESGPRMLCAREMERWK